MITSSVTNNNLDNSAEILDIHVRTIFERRGNYVLIRTTENSETYLHVAKEECITLNDVASLNAVVVARVKDIDEALRSVRSQSQAGKRDVNNYALAASVLNQRIAA